MSRLYYGLMLRSPAPADVFLGQSTGYVDAFVLAQLFETDSATAVNIGQTIGFVDVSVPSQEFGSLSVLPQATGFIDLKVFSQEFVAETTDIHVPQTTGFVDLKVFSQAFVAEATDHILPQTTGFVDINVFSQQLTSDTLDIQLPQTTGFVDLKVFSQAFVTDTAADIGLPQTTGFVDVAVVSHNFQAVAVNNLNVPQTTGFIDLKVFSQQFVTDTAAADISLPQTTGMIDSVVTSQVFQAGTVANIQLNQTTGFVDVKVFSQQFVTDTTAADITLPQTTGFVDSRVVSQGMSTDTPTAASLPQTTGFVNSAVISQTLDEAGESTGISANFNGNAWMERTVAGYQTGVNDGAVRVTFKSDHTFSNNEHQTLFAASGGAAQGGDTPRLEFGMRDNFGVLELFIEFDNGTFTWIFAWDPLTDLTDNQHHDVIFASDGSDWHAYLDGVKLADPDPPSNTGEWFGQIQTQAGINFNNVQSGGFRHDETNVDQFFTGLMDEMLVFDDNLTFEQAIWLQSTQATIPQIETLRPDIWTKVANAWELANDATRDIGDEYVVPTADYFTLNNITASGEGIRGILQLAADMDGSATALQVNDNASLDHSGAVTLAIWCRFDDATPAQSEGVVAKTLSGTEYAVIRDVSTNKITLRAFDTSTKIAFSTPTISNDRFYLIIAKVDATSAQVVIGDSLGTALSYGSTVAMASGVRLTASHLEFGLWSGSNHMDGAIDDCVLFHHKTSTTEDDYLYGVTLGQGRTINVIAQDNPTLYAKVKSHWHFNENSGTREDDVGNNDATTPAGKTNPASRTGHVVD